MPSKTWARLPRLSAAHCLSGAKTLLVGLALSLLAGCSSTTFFYNRLDTFISWYVDDFVTLTPAQEADFDVRLGRLLSWHRREELPRYVEYLNTLDRLLANGDISGADTDAVFQNFQGAAERLQVAAQAMMLEFAVTLAPEQRQEFMAELKKNQREQKEEYLERSDEAFREDNVQRIEDNLREFTGKLSREQKALIEAESARFIRLDALWLEDRDRWIAELDAVISANEPNWLEQTKGVLEQRRSARREEYNQGFEHNAQVTRELLRKVINLRSPEQDRRLRRNLRSYREDFETLIAEAEPEN